MTRILAALLAVLPAMTPKLDHDRLLRVIASVEGGKAGDLGGSMHLSYSSWTQHTKHPYQLSKTESYARNIASIHLSWLIRSLKDIGIEPSAHNLGVAWRRGLSRAQELHFKDEYGTRIENLYLDPSFK